MMRNGPKIRLNNAPGRRITSSTSLTTKAVVRVQLLSGPSSNSFTSLDFFELAPVVVLPAICPSDKSGEHLIKGGPVLGAGFNGAAGCLDRRDHARSGGSRIVGDHQELAWR